MFQEMQVAGVGGGTTIAPTVIQSWYTNSAINYTYTIDKSKTYLFVMGYPRDGMWQQQQLVKMIKNGEISVVYGTDNTTVGTLALSGGTSLSYTRDSVTYPIYTWFIQLD